MSELHLVARFRAIAETAPDRPLYTFVEDDGRDGERRTYGEAKAEVGAIAAYLLGRGDLAAGDRVLLVYPPGIDFAMALLACLWAGLVPVPVAPPDPLNPGADLSRLAGLAGRAQIRAILSNRLYQRARTVGEAKQVVGSWFGRQRTKWPALPWITTDGCAAASAPAPVVGALEDVALLQFTSGSTSEPKGVRITFGNLAHQLEANARELGQGPDARLAMWVPHFHDFGLISGLLSAAWGNGPLHFMSPLAFIRRPASWFDLLSRVRATHTAAPNFAYELAVRRTTPEERARWDLRELRVMMSAAEAVRADTVKAFLDAFAPSGLRRDAYCPAYGLAEHTVGVSVFGRGSLVVDRELLEGRREVSPASGQGRRSVTLMACGAPSAGVRVRIVSPETGEPCADGHVGEIWVDSPSKADGYEGLPEASRETFEASLPGEAARYLRTGDLGFLHEGQIYVTGRLKELIILRGRNLYPQDVEASVRGAHADIRPGGVAAFAAPDGPGGADRLVVLAEVRKPVPAAVAEAIAGAVRQQVIADHGAPVFAVVVGPAGLVPKTTSGKTRRGEARAAFLAGTYAEAHVVRYAPDDGLPAVPPADARLEGLEPEFQGLVRDVARRFTALSRARQGRAFHKEATTLLGTLEVLDRPELPAHGFFEPGRRLPVLVRHANGVADDDAAPDNRGATLRVLDPDRPGDLEAGLLDLLLTTGECFLQRSAAGFQQWTAASAAEREALVRAEPHLGRAAWEMVRTCDHFADMYYYAKTASRFLPLDGSAWVARFRLAPDRLPPEGNRVDPGGAALPPDLLPRRPGDDRSPTFLHERLRQDVASGPLTYRLQVQLQAEPPGADAHDALLDCTRPWTEPWRDVAVLRMDRLADPAEIEPLAFNPGRAPAELALPLAASPHESASLAHLRSIVYELSALGRQDRPVPDELAPFASGIARLTALDVCVVGAGPTGLAAARALEARGHRVTVLERGAEVGGKGRSVQLDGHWFDLGGHYCTDNYHRLGAMVREVGAAIVPATPGQVYDLETRAVRPPGDDAALGRNYLRFAALRDAQFPSLRAPGLASVAGQLGGRAGAWVAAQGLEGLAEAIGVTYTASGYGYWRVDDLPAMYFLKAAETLVGAGTGADLPTAWTVEGGFGPFWARVAGTLRDVRCGVAIRRIVRGGPQIEVTTEEGDSWSFDRVVLACPMDQAMRLVDASDEEREVLGRIRTLDYYTTIATVHGLPREGFFLVTPNAEDPTRVGHPVAFHHRYPDSDVYLFYAYGGEGIRDQAVVERLAADVARMGGTLETVHSHHRWSYFPHYGTADVEAGIYDRLEALQGQRGTYFAGSIFNFELMECNVAYAEDLVGRFFGAGTDSDRGGYELRTAAERRVAKAQRSTARQVLAGIRGADLATADRQAAALAYLQAVFAEELEGPAPTPGAAFTELGLDSITSVQLFHRLCEETGLPLAPSIFVEHTTVEALASSLAADFEAASRGPAPGAGAGGAAAVDPVEAALAEMSDAEVDALLADLMAQEGAS